MIRHMAALGVALASASGPPLAAGDRDTKVHEDRRTVGGDDRWIYNDLGRGLDEARRTGKPLLVVFR